MYALDAIIRKCFNDQLYAFLSFNEPHLGYDRIVSLKTVAPYFRYALNYSLGSILAPVELFPTLVKDEPYFHISKNEAMYKICKIPNMLDYWHSLGGKTPRGAGYLLLGISKKHFREGKAGIARGCIEKTNQHSPPFCIGFL